MNYRDLKEKHQKEVNDFPLFAAFSNEQFKKAMEERGLKETDTDKIIKIGCGCFILKKDRHLFHEMMDRHEEERKEALKDDEYIYTMFRYELANHEYCITYDYEDTLEALGFTFEQVREDERLYSALLKAKKDYLNNCENE